MRRPVPRAGRVVSEVVVMSAALGPLVGWAWSVLAPAVQVEVVRDGEVLRAALHAAQAERQFGVDGWFAVLGIGAGLLVGAVSLVRHHRRPGTVLVALAVAGAGGSGVALWIGMALGPGPLDPRVGNAPVGATVAVPLELHALGVLLVWPIAAVTAALALAAVMEDRSPWRRPPDPVNQVSRSAPSAPL